MQRKHRRKKAGRRRVHKEERLVLEQLLDANGKPLNAFDLAIGRDKPKQPGGN